MKKILLFGLICFITHNSLGQLGFKNSNAGRMMDLTDLDGHSLLKNYDPDITGSPFIIDNWIPAKITLSKGKVIEPLSVKLNIETNELYYRDSAGKEMIATGGVIKKIECYDFSKDNTQYVFKNGYPVVDKQNENFYYQTLTEGKIELLAKKFKYIRVNKNQLTGEITKEFVEGATVLYVYTGNTMQAFQPKKSFVISLMKDKEEAITKFIDTSKTNFRKTPDLIKLFKYYNELE